MCGGDGVEKTEQRAVRKTKQADLVTGSRCRWDFCLAEIGTPRGKMSSTLGT